MAYNCGDILESKDLVTVWRVEPLWGLELGDGRQVDTSCAAVGGCRGVSLEANQVWHHWDKHEARHNEYRSEDPEVTMKHSWWHHFRDWIGVGDQPLKCSPKMQPVSAAL